MAYTWEWLEKEAQSLGYSAEQLVWAHFMGKCNTLISHPMEIHELQIIIKNLVVIIDKKEIQFACSLSPCQCFTVKFDGNYYEIMDVPQSYLAKIPLHSYPYVVHRQIKGEELEKLLEELEETK